MIAQAIKRRMANPPFPVVSESHYKHFDKEVCDNWDTLRGKDKSTMRPRRAAGVSINSPLMAAGTARLWLRSQPESGKACTAALLSIVRLQSHRESGRAPRVLVSSRWLWVIT